MRGGGAIGKIKIFIEGIIVKAGGNALSTASLLIVPIEG